MKKLPWEYDDSGASFELELPFVGFVSCLVEQDNDGKYFVMFESEDHTIFDYDFDEIASVSKGIAIAEKSFSSEIKKYVAKKMTELKKLSDYA